MEQIRVIFWNNKTKEKESVIVENYGLIQAIEDVRHIYEYRILVICAQYFDEDKLINSLFKYPV